MELTPDLRLTRLEAVEAIKTLKHRYLRACDAKQPEVFRDCFVAKGASIDYGPRIGRFEDADGIAEVFRKMALERVDGKFVIFDMHHAFHPDIRLTGETEATGAWTLQFRQVNLKDHTERLSAIEYDDRYEVEDGQWRIRSCHVRVLWSRVQPLPEGFEMVDALS
jgi:hypothetical protein